MATSPSRQFDENGVLVQRAIATDVAGDPDEVEAKADQPYKAPEQKFNVTGKAVTSTSAENKAAKASKASKK